MIKTLWALALIIASARIGVAAAATPALTITSPWSRPAIGTGVVYATIADTGALPDRLIGAESPVAQAVELHTSYATHQATGAMRMPGMAMDEVMSMRRVASIAVPAHGTVRFAPGGNHIMLIGLRHDLHTGDVIPLRLHFARAGWIALRVPVRAM